MMQEAPGRERPLPSLEATAALREALADAIEELSPEEQFIIERLLIEGLSLRHTGWMMNIPKTTLARVRDKVRERLMLKIVDYEHIRHWIEPNLD
jgi:DNA-directed RNA polymerase specialized sigma24 family protein